MQFYCTLVQTPFRQQSITDKFANFSICPKFVEYTKIFPKIETLRIAQENGVWDKDCWDYMHCHMQCLNQFLMSNDDMAVIFEDQILMHKDFAQHLPNIISRFVNLDLDIMLLGYNNVVDSQQPIVFHQYSVETCRCQMYMIRRRYAEHVFTYFGPHSIYQESNLLNPGAYPAWPPYSADRIIARMCGPKELVIPPMCVNDDYTNHQNIYI